MPFQSWFAWQNMVTQSWGCGGQMQQSDNENKILGVTLWYSAVKAADWAADRNQNRPPELL